MKNGEPLNEMRPHIPENEDERTRIENEGGIMLHCSDTWRVNDVLAVSRVIGDPDHKPYVSAELDVQVVDLDGTGDFLILACDGLWDQVDAKLAIALVYEHLAFVLILCSCLVDPVFVCALSLPSSEQSIMDGTNMCVFLFCNDGIIVCSRALLLTYSRLLAEAFKSLNSKPAICVSLHRENQTAKNGHFRLS